MALLPVCASRRDACSTKVPVEEASRLLDSSALTWRLAGHNLTLTALDPGLVVDAVAIKDNDVFVRFLPDYRLGPGLQLRAAVSIDGGAAQTVTVPESAQEDDEVAVVRLPLGSAPN